MYKFELLVICVTQSSQIYPIPFDIYHLLPATTAPAKFSLTCRFGFMQTDCDAFTIALSQAVHDASAQAHVNVCAYPVHPGWLLLPFLFPNVVATLSGNVLAFQDGVVVVLVENLFLAHRSSQAEPTRIMISDLESLD